VKLKLFTCGPFQTNAYLLYKEKEAVLIDAPPDCGDISVFLKEHDLGLKAILLTHGHYDHIAGLPLFPGVPVWSSEAEREMLSDPEKNLSSVFGEKSASFSGSALSEVFDFAGEVIRVISVPGHTAGGVAFYLDGMLFSGDSLFHRSVGRTDFPGGHAKNLVKNIKERLFPLPPGTEVWPGHGPKTCIEDEKRENPFLR